ncbi:heavy metal translocating P-type ATPase [Vogesella sp. LIG4]|uniref:heavy metal translocating P-type ATPase n=1 Tax=Vogesella sp. LIG4 TaxID=1192162 RepID=UPI00082004D9|nr:heavy metal translocating P-type ATPase [Vogesella sp. LIG4]SCK04933.1 Cd2+/Zn2+-exporting ATPase [Vogesella sp. LIG4]
MGNCCQHDDGACQNGATLSPLPQRHGQAPDDAHHHGHEHGHAHEHDHHHQHEPAAAHEHTHDACGCDAAASVIPAAAPPAGSLPWRLAIPAMDCPTEGRMVEKALHGMAGVLQLDFNYIERTLIVHQQGASLAAVQQALATTGLAAELQRDAANVAVPARPARWPLLASGALALLAEALVFAGQAETGWPVVALAAVSMLLGGHGTARKGWYALKSRSLNIYFLMSLAVAGAMLLGQWPEAAMVLFLFALSERLEAMSLARAGAAVRALMALKPELAWVQQGEGWQQVAAGSVTVGRMVRVRPGERVPLDGRIASGHSDFDEAAINGESLPLAKGPGDTVFAGTINGAGLVTVQVTASADGSLLARIIERVRDAQAGKAATQRFIDRFAAVYTPLVVALAVLFAIGAPLAGWLPWQQALYQALVLLVIACPCALVIATPVTLVSALSAAARHGMLIKGGAALETAARVRVVALDKTGTLTRGQPALADIRCLDAALDQRSALQLAASLEAHSTHPLARAVLQAAQKQGIALLPAEALQELAGEGVIASIGGVRHGLGNARLAARLGVNEAALAGGEHAQRGGMLLCRDGQLLAALQVADSLRPEAQATVAALQRQGMRLMVLSGDHAAEVARMAAAAGIADAAGALLPEDKLASIRTLGRHGAVAMVGDGVNDAPAMAQAELGIAMGAAGSDVALETAQVALMEDRLDKLPQLFAHARRSMALLRANIVLALAIKLVFFVLALAGVASLWMAVFADVGASLLVIFNGLRLARPIKE